MGNPGGGVSSQEWDRLAENPKFLRIDQRSDQIVVIDDSDHAQTFYPDGKKHNDKDADGNKISTKASWEGSAFIAETKLPHSEKLTQTFRMSEDGKQLHVITRFDASSGNASVSIRRVYDPGKAPSQ
jgi:prolyl-tRNA synthetase